MILRPYQEKTRSAVHDEWVDNQSTLVQWPTGTGKTRLASAIIKDRSEIGRSLFLCHRTELVNQAAEHIRKVTGLSVGIEMGEYKVVNNGLFSLPQVVVATIQTLSSGGDGGGRIGKFSPEDFNTIVADECHHAVSPSWKKVINYFLNNKSCKLLGISATCDRADEEALGQVFESVAFNYPLADPSHAEPNAIDDGWLVPVDSFMVSVEAMDLTNVGTTCGELNGPDLEAVLENEKLIQETVEAIYEIMHGLPPKSLYHLPINEWESQVAGIKPRRAIAFTRFVKHAEILSNILNRISPGFSGAISEKTRKEERPLILNSFKKGSPAIIGNADILTEGYDDDGVEIVFMCAPTKSRSKYAQRAGRATRPHSSIAHTLNNSPIAAIRRGMIARSPKPVCTLIDFVGDSGRHKLCFAADLLAGNISDEAVEAAINFAKKLGKPIRMDKQLEEEEKKIAEIKLKRAEEEARKARLVAKTSYKLQKVDPFDIFGLKKVKPHGWDEGKILSEKCKKILRVNLGIDPDSIDYSAGMQLVREQIRRWNENLCSIKQAKILKKHGIKPDVTFDNASRMIDAIAKNGWRGLPEGFNLNTTDDGKQLADSGDEVPF